MYGPPLRSRTGMGSAYDFFFFYLFILKIFLSLQHSVILVILHSTQVVNSLYIGREKRSLVIM